MSGIRGDVALKPLSKATTALVQYFFMCNTVMRNEQRFAINVSRARCGGKQRPPFSEWRNGLESDPGLKVRPEEATGRDDARKRGCEESAAKKTVTAPAKREPALSSRSEWGHKDWR